MSEHGLPTVGMRISYSRRGALPTQAFDFVLEKFAVSDTQKLTGENKFTRFHSFDKNGVRFHGSLLIKLMPVFL